MSRTQIYLEENQLKTLRREAERRRATVSEIIRAIIREKFEASRRGSHTRDREGLLAAARRINRIGEKGPKDLASRLDAYIYGKKWPNFC